MGDPPNLERIAGNRYSYSIGRWPAIFSLAGKRSKAERSELLPLRGRDPLSLPENPRLKAENRKNLFYKRYPRLLIT
jgi:hypothetical protein